MRHKAIYNIYPNVVSVDDTTGSVDKDGNKVVIDETKISKEIDRLQADYDALEYSRKRKSEYPDWGTQLNKIYDDGIEKWKTEMVDPIKTKYPKP
tara:strand:+ start:11784 stop:12068 length:285 start_codon:yes stop_codon:yes gene_type:complete